MLRRVVVNPQFSIHVPPYHTAGKLLSNLDLKYAIITGLILAIIGIILASTLQLPLFGLPLGWKLVVIGSASFVTASVSTLVICYLKNKYKPVFKARAYVRNERKKIIAAAKEEIDTAYSKQEIARSSVPKWLYDYHDCHAHYDCAKRCYDVCVDYYDYLVSAAANSYLAESGYWEPFIADAKKAVCFAKEAKDATYLAWALGDLCVEASISLDAFVQTYSPEDIQKLIKIFKDIKAKIDISNLSLPLQELLTSLERCLDTLLKKSETKIDLQDTGMSGEFAGTAVVDEMIRERRLAVENVREYTDAIRAKATQDAYWREDDLVSCSRRNRCCPLKAIRPDEYPKRFDITEVYT